MDEPTVLHVVNEVNEGVPEDVLASPPVGELEVVTPKDHGARGSELSCHTDSAVYRLCS